jgi:hypothetical protein
MIFDFDTWEKMEMVCLKVKISGLWLARDFEIQPRVAENGRKNGRKTIEVPKFDSLSGNRPCFSMRESKRIGIAGLGLDRIRFNVCNEFGASRMIDVQFLPQVVKKLDLQISGRCANSFHTLSADSYKSKPAWVGLKMENLFNPMVYGIIISITKTA